MHGRQLQKNEETYDYSVGVAFAPNSQWTLAADYTRIAYSKVAAVGGPSSAPAPLGAGNGPGFGWRDVDVIKLGAAYRMSPALTLRVGFNHGTNPVRPQDVTFNILAPGVVKNHASAGFTYGISNNSEISGALMVAQRVSVSGPSLFNAVLGPGAGGNESVRMRQVSVGLAWAQKF